MNPTNWRGYDMEVWIKSVDIWFWILEIWLREIAFPCGFSAWLLVYHFSLPPSLLLTCIWGFMVIGWWTSCRNCYSMLWGLSMFDTTTVWNNHGVIGSTLVVYVSPYFETYLKSKFCCFLFRALWLLWRRRIQFLRVNWSRLKKMQIVPGRSWWKLNAHVYSFNRISEGSSSVVVNL